jgi:hypothetical protein
MLTLICTHFQDKPRSIIIGTPGVPVEQQAQLVRIGTCRVLLPWLDLDDIDGLETIGTAVLPQSGCVQNQ